jgi:hypothetical protein
MCHYITAVFPRDADLGAVRSVLDRHKFGFGRIYNSHVQAQLRPGDVQILTTRKRCDCGTPLASESRHDKGTAHSDTVLRKLRARDWSEARIQRWLAEKAVAAENAARIADERRAEETRQVQRWLDCIAELLNSGATDRVAVLVHWYRLHVARERIDLGQTTRVSLGELSADALLEMREDALFEVRAPA